MKRKIVKQGKSALTITLPFKWAQKFNLSDKDEIEVEERGKELVISPEKGVSLEKKEIKIEPGTKRFIKSIISNAYKKGYEELKIYFDDLSLMKPIRLSTEELLGYEIVEQGNNHCVIKNVAAGLETELDTMLRRVFLQLLSVSDTAYESVKKGEFKNLHDLLELDASINKLTDFCKRILIKKGYKDYNSTMFIYLIVWHLEKTANEYKYICEYVSENKVRATKETLNLFEDINKMLRIFYECYYKPDLKRMSELANMREENFKKGKELLKTKPHKEVMIVHHLITLVLKIYEMGGPYFGVLL